MAVHAPITGAPARAILLPTANTPLGRILAQFDRSKLEAAIEVMIGLLDATEPDHDLEDSEACNGRIDARGRYLPPLVMPEQDEDREPDDDDKGDMAYTEWHTRGRHKLDAFGSEPSRDRVNGGTCHEDAEDDDGGEDREDDEDSGDAEEDDAREDTDDVEADDHPPVTAYAVANDA